jgi:hypothetical protein
MQVAKQRILGVPIAIVILSAGCESRDERLAEFAGHALDQQASQSEAIARQSQQVAHQSSELAEAAHKLVEQDAQARRELIQAQADLQSQFSDERTGLDKQRDALHAEQKAVAAAAIREPLIAQAVVVAALILAALLPLLVTAYALRRLPDHGGCEVLLETALLDDLARLPPELPCAREPASLTRSAAVHRIAGAGEPSDPSAAAARRQPT